MRDARDGLARHAYNGTYVLQSVDPTDPAKQQTASTGYGRALTSTGWDVTSPSGGANRVSILGHWGFQHYLNVQDPSTQRYEAYSTDGFTGQQHAGTPYHEYTFTLKNRDREIRDTELYGTPFSFLSSVDVTYRFLDGLTTVASFTRSLSSVGTGFFCTGDTNLETAENVGNSFETAQYTFANTGYEISPPYNTSCTPPYDNGYPTYTGIGQMSGDSSIVTYRAAAGIKYRVRVTSASAQLPPVYADATTAYANVDLVTGGEPAPVEHPIAYVSGVWSPWNSWLSGVKVYDPSTCTFTTAIPSPNTTSTASWTTQLPNGKTPFYSSHGITTTLWYDNYGLYANKVVKTWLFSVNFLAFSVDGTDATTVTPTFTDCYVPTDYTRCMSGAHGFAPSYPPTPICTSTVYDCGGYWSGQDCVTYATDFSYVGSTANYTVKTSDSPGLIGALYTYNEASQPCYCWGGDVRYTYAQDIESIASYYTPGPDGVGIFGASRSLTVDAVDPVLWSDGCYNSGLGISFDHICTRTLVTAYPRLSSSPSEIDLSSLDLPLDDYTFQFVGELYQGSLFFGSYPPLFKTGYPRVVYTVPGDEREYYKSLFVVVAGVYRLVDLPTNAINGTNHQLNAPIPRIKKIVLGLDENTPESVYYTHVNGACPSNPGELPPDWSQDILHSQATLTVRIGKGR